MFTSYPAYPKYRALKLTTPNTQGEDVFALQTALIVLNFLAPKTTSGQPNNDGYLGPLTSEAIKRYQTARGLKPIDSIAGLITQRELATEIAKKAAVDRAVPYARVYGQIEGESSFWIGIYSQQYSNESYDAGATQRNTKFTPPEEGFAVQPSIFALIDRIKEHYDHFTGIPDDRRWDLAQGSWNAPASACFIAYEEGAKNDWVAARKSKTLSDANRQKIETYIAKVSVYA